MFLNDVHKKEEIQCLAIADLKKIGIKYRPKKSRQFAEEKRNRKVFKRPLHFLPVETVTLPSGQQLLVPKIVHELCTFVIQKIDTEGLFRKGGSKNRQNEIKLTLDAGCYLSDEHHEIDVASVLKTFFRELPDPLIPYSFHELFLRCVLLENNQVEATLLACLLLPTVHLNTLAYFMQFLYRVTEYYEFNKMNAYNIAVVIGPTLFPPEEKIPHNATLRMTKTCDLFKLLITNASNIGVLNNSIIERIPQNSSSDNEDNAATKKKKKRRSGSLTRILNGFKKIVTHKSEDISAQAPPDLVFTPSLTRSSKKRRFDAVGLSAKKRKDIINTLPQNALLSTPFTPSRTPVHSHPNGTAKSAKEKRLLWSNAKRKNKKTVETSSTSLIQRRWSAVTSSTGFKKKSRTKIDTKLDEIQLEVQSTMKNEEEVDYVRISKAEYEEIKSRVSAIERRISVELENNEIESQKPITAVEEVTKKYEETLVNTETLSPTTDQLAKRLSRELQIRRSSENRQIFRSPSARKIGSIRRKEGNKRLSRTHTWNGNNLKITPKSKLKRAATEISETSDSNSIVPETVFNSVVTDSSGGSWKSAQGFFNTPEMPIPAMDNNCRASIARLRSQNAGMVLAKARLFDSLRDEHVEEPEIAVQRMRTTKMGAQRHQLSRIRTLRMEDRKKKSMSPRKRPCRQAGVHKMPKSALVLREVQSESLNGTPKHVPHIKQHLSAAKSMSKLCKMGIEKENSSKTPLKATRLSFK